MYRSIHTWIMLYLAQTKSGIGSGDESLHIDVQYIDCRTYEHTHYHGFSRTTRSLLLVFNLIFQQIGDALAVSTRQISVTYPTYTGNHIDEMGIDDCLVFV